MNVLKAHCVLVGILVACQASQAQDTPLELFEQRIMPIFRSPKPSSCVQCHLASVDLKDYIRPSHEETFLTLRDRGMIDVEHPESSKILQLISMGEQDRDALARRIHERNRKAEYDAFAAWIKACCEDRELVSRPHRDTEPIPDKPVEIIRHARKDRVLDSFVRNVWSQRMRCFPCHTPNEIDPSNPKHKRAKETHQKFVKEYGAKMNLFQQTPLQTMRSLLASSRKSSKKRLPLINLDEPTASLLVLKPTSKLPAKRDDGTFEKPSAVPPVTHMGGLKMHVDDVSYKALVGWIQDVADLRSQHYETAADLPADNWYPSKHVLRLKDVPEDWPVMGRVQMFVYNADPKSGKWSETPIAFTQGVVTPRRFANGPLMLLRPESASHQSHAYADSGEAEFANVTSQPDTATGEQELESPPQAADARAADARAADVIDSVQWDPESSRLPAGKYLIKIYLDQHDRIAKDPTVMLGEDDLKGQLVVDAAWNEGFPNAEVVSAKDLSL